MKKSVFCILAALSLFITTNAFAGDVVDCTYNGIPLNGKVKVVQHHEDIKVKIVEYHEDVRVKVVEHHPNTCGVWKFVEHHEDFKVKFVEHHEDIKVRYVQHHPGAK
ncbi:MAG: hypothetical protein WC966_08345 [Bradymonadales bacterium]|jgi:hypothetical protein